MVHSKEHTRKRQQRDFTFSLGVTGVETSKLDIFLFPVDHSFLAANSYFT